MKRVITKERVEGNCENSTNKESRELNKPKSAGARVRNKKRFVEQIEEIHKTASQKHHQHIASQVIP